MIPTPARPGASSPTAAVPLALLAAITPVLVLTAIFCRAGRLNWLLEVGPALLGFIALAATYRRVRLTNFCYVCVFLHTLIPVYGGYYTYAATPLGNWARDTFHLARNHYDRVGTIDYLTLLPRSGTQMVAIPTVARYSCGRAHRW